MNRAYLKNIFRTIWRTRTRFLSVAVIIALGVGFMSGLLSTAPSMEESVDTYYDSTNTFDIRLLSALGFSDDDITALSDIDGVEFVEGGYSVDFIMETDTDSLVVRLESRNFGDEDYLNQVVLVEGSLPTSSDECVIESEVLGLISLEIGDYITVSVDGVAYTEFEIVGTVSSAYYMSKEGETSSVGSGQVSIIAYTYPEAFDYDQYTVAHLTLEGSKDYDAFSDKYTQFEEEKIEELESFAEVQSLESYEAIIAEINESVADAQAELDEAIAEAYLQFEEVESELISAKAEIDSGFIQLEQAKTELELASTEYENGVLEYTDGVAVASATRSYLEGIKFQLDTAQIEIDEQSTAINSAVLSGAMSMEEAEIYLALLEQSQLELDQNILEYEIGYAELVAGELLLEETITALDTAKAEIESSTQLLADTEIELETALLEYSEGLESYNEELENAEIEFSDAQAEIDEIKLEIEDIDEPEWYVLDRNANATYVSFASNADKIHAISTVFPLIFFLVALLVCFTTMTRMVDEERVQIGTFKALGYRKSQIAIKYIIYGALATIIGSILGLIAGHYIFPTVIYNSYSILYTFPEFINNFNFEYATIAFSSAVAVITIAVVYAVYGALKSVPSQLMIPKAPKAGKRIFLEKITPLWKRMGFFSKVTARNLIRYKGRFFMTIIGVGGCTAMLVTGFGLYNSVSGIVHNQYGEIQEYNITATGDSEEAFYTEEITDILSTDNIYNTLIYSQEGATIVFGDLTNDIYLFSPQENELDGMINLHDRTSGEQIALTDDGVVITEKICITMGIEVGDTITVENADGISAEITVTGICENYVYNLIYLTNTAYSEYFGTDASFNSIAIKTDADYTDDLTEILLAEDCITGVSDIEALKEYFDDTITTILFIVFILIVAAALLVFVVLINLININIEERSRELATTKVLGFNLKDLASYIYREILILTGIGTGVGLVAGIFLHKFVVVTAETDNMMFGREIQWWSFAVSGAMTIIFALMVLAIMLPKLRKIDMVESMKAVE